MPGSFDLGGQPTNLAGQAPLISVYLYDPSGPTFTLLPNVVCTQIEYKAGPDPPIARFRYLMDDLYAANLGWPSRVEDVWPIDAVGPYVVNVDDRLVVATTNPDNSPLYLFDGFADVPQADMGPKMERVTFTASGVAVRAWDDVIHTRVQRDADQPTDTTGLFDYEIHDECRFNPADQRPGSLGGILGNATPDQFYTVPVDSAGNKDQANAYPVFVDPLLLERQQAAGGGTVLVDQWYVGDALIYLLQQPSPADDYVNWPSNGTVKQILGTYAPVGAFNPLIEEPVTLPIRDYNAAGKTLPAVLHDLLGYAGFEMSWVLGADDSQLPETSLLFFRRDAASTTPIKQVYLDQPGAFLAQGSVNNVVQLHLARDTSGVVNASRVETGQRQVELTVTLAPLFTPDAADATPGNSPLTGINQFDQANLLNATAATRRKYRWYGADECGDGYYDMFAGQWVADKPIDLTPVFPNDQNGARTYVKRYRPGTHTLLARDSAGKPLKAVLEYYAPDGQTYSSAPQVQQNTNIPQCPPAAVPQGQPPPGWVAIKSGWRLLPDRLGIEVIAKHPEEWATGNTLLPKIAGVSQVALAGQKGYNPFTLRLTTTIYADTRITAQAPKRAASPTQFARWRSIDARDHFQLDQIAVGSINYTAAGGDGADPYSVRDDTTAATTHAEQIRSAHEMPVLAGSVTIPGIATGYQIGDRINLVQGRNISLVTNGGAATGESPAYPWVIGIQFQLDPHQYTRLLLGDKRADQSHNAW